MSNFDGIERRSSYPKIEVDIALIKQKIDFIVEKLELLSGENIVSRSDFDNHIIYDRWLFLIIVTLIIAIKLIR